MVEKSAAMKQHEKWIEETLKHKPKHTREGLPMSEDNRSPCACINKEI
jgi:hypothetical protein